MDEATEIGSIYRSEHRAFIFVFTITLPCAVYTSFSARTASFSCDWTREYEIEPTEAIVCDDRSDGWLLFRSPISS